ncbi:hypothetical protein FSP39_002661 [Pinctada imbricata]|uniref:Mediator of RNA polymerase II transcription subunit 14 n=1 Tax=Pinctada imbricata TaxID=66713 RepID=A0AA88Y2V6_PINIB|nr:hypothetical protein FSP39_002661 [Pinctada imbricata]
MPPIDGNMAVAGMPQGVGTIPLATLIEYAVQRTYHELSVLSELLPRKNDMERKVEIVQYASRTRQLFIRLLALVKWAGSATKVDKCAEICSFLEQQSMWFVETADILAKMARETLVNARLPAFSLHCAIDVLTLGTYPRLPACIRDKIVPPDAITPSEKRQTLQRLTQVIQYRLVSADLPQQMRKLRVENGRVKFIVEHEFEATLTLMGDGPKVPWRLLDINFLVEDPETGDTFCQSLQLEVLHSQTQRLIKDRMGDSICVENYTIGRCLVVSYWRDQLRRDRSGEPTIHNLKVHVADDDDSKPLQISHQPSMSVEESNRVGSAIKSNHLSIERLLMQTIEVRCHAKLKVIVFLKVSSSSCELRDLPIALHVPILSPCMNSEKLRIMIDSERGTLLASIPVLSELPEINDFEEALNGDRRGLEGHINNIKIQMCMLRCEKSTQYLPTSCQRQLPIVNMVGHPVEKLSPHTLFIRVPKQANYFLIVELLESECKNIKYKYYLLDTSPCTSDGSEDQITEEISAKLFLKAGRLMELDPFSFTHGPYTKIFDDPEETEIEGLRRKRKILLGEYDGPKNKKSKGNAYFVPDLAYILASCEERIQFVNLGVELEKNGVVHSGIHADSEGTCFCLSIASLPDVDGLDKKICEKIKKLLLSLKLRILSRPTRNWIVEFVFAKSPLQSATKKEQGSVIRVHYMFELNIDNLKKVVKDILDEWSSICHLYSLVDEFAVIYNDSRTSLHNTADIQSYDYRRLTLYYGPNRNSVAILQWKGDAKQFTLTLGSVGQTATLNPHIPVVVQLQQELNASRSLAQLAQTLYDTWSPMTSINKLSTSLVQAANTTIKETTQSFTIIPQSTTHVRIAFRYRFCVDIHFRGNKIVAVRDGAYSLFDNSKVVDSFTPTPMLKAFLNMYVDDSITGRHTHRMSATEDDNPPSPVLMDSVDVFNMSQPPSMGSPVSRRQDASIRFSSPMTPPSNPHTPASPSTVRMSGVTPSPSTALIGTPSPGNLLGAGSPGNPQLHVPSPGSFVPAPSPQSLGIHMPSPAGGFMGPSGIDAGSPFTSSGLAMPSPGQRNWPNSPSVPGPSPASRHAAHSPGHPALHSPQTQAKDGDHSKTSGISHPSRMLPQRSWAASIPTLLSHESLDTLLTPNKLPSVTHAILLSPLERFLGCVFLRRNLIRLIHTESLTALQSSDPYMTLFKAETLQFRVSFNTSNFQSLHMNVTPLPEHSAIWTTEVLNIVEQYFDQKVACPPYKVNALRAFLRILDTPPRVLKDCIQLMRLELTPQAVLDPRAQMKWSMQLCLTLPPVWAYMASAGNAAVAKGKQQKILMMLQLTRISSQLPPGTEPQTIIVPLLYDMNNNTIQQADLIRGQQTTPTYVAVSQMLKRYSDFHQSSSDCILFSAVRELLTNLVIQGS